MQYPFLEAFYFFELSAKYPKSRFVEKKEQNQSLLVMSPDEIRIVVTNSRPQTPLLQSATHLQVIRSAARQVFVEDRIERCRGRAKQEY